MINEKWIGQDFEGYILILIDPFYSLYLVVD
jgi:hypothetical protein